MRLSCWIQCTVELTDMLHPRCKWVLTVWLNYSVLFPCFHLAVLVTKWTFSDVFWHDLDIKAAVGCVCVCETTWARLKAAQVTLCRSQQHFSPLTVLFYACANRCSPAARTPQTFSSFTAGCLLVGGLAAAAAHSRLSKEELCDYKPIIPL